MQPGQTYTGQLRVPDYSKHEQIPVGSTRELAECVTSHLGAGRSSKVDDLA